MNGLVPNSDGLQPNSDGLIPVYECFILFLCKQLFLVLRELATYESMNHSSSGSLVQKVLHKTTWQLPLRHDQPQIWSIVSVKPSNSQEEHPSKLTSHKDDAFPTPSQAVTSFASPTEPAPPTHHHRFCHRIRPSVAAAEYPARRGAALATLRAVSGLRMAPR